MTSGRAGFEAPDEDFARRLQELARVTARLAAAARLDEIVDVVVSHVAGPIGAAVSTLMLVEGDRLRLVGAHGVRRGVEEEFAEFGLGDANPASESARTGRPVILGDTEVIRRTYPDIRDHMPAQRSLICLPLNVGGTTLGVIGLTFDDHWLPGPRELDLLTTFADSCAQAVRRVRAIEQSDERARRLALLADASSVLASSLDYRVTLSNVAQLVVRTLADWCAVDVLQDGELTTLAVAHVDPAKVEWAWQLQERYPPDPDADSGAPNVVRTGQTELYPEVTDEMLVAAARDDEHLRLNRELDLRSVLIVPLNAQGRTLGAITMLRTGDAPPFDASDVSLAEDLARRAGVAVDNALLHRSARNVALELQRAVLPGNLARETGWPIATYYRPGGTADVGGDFYDALTIAPGVLAAFIGDVMGHGVSAAAAMAQMRAAVRAYASIDPEPETIIHKLDAMFARLEIGRLATLAYVLIDVPAGELRIGNAGHYPPLLVSRSGGEVFAEAEPERPLGAGGDERRVLRCPVRVGDVVLLYTDGLVERRGEPIDAGLARLRAAASVLRDRPVDEALQALVERVEGDGGDDDVTAVAVSVNPDP